MIETVNGYACFNCTDVENAKKGVDPAQPKTDEPFDSQIKTENEIAVAKTQAKTQISPAVVLGGALAELSATNRTDPVLSPTTTNDTATHQTPSPAASPAPKAGAQLNLSV